MAKKKGAKPEAGLLAACKAIRDDGSLWWHKGCCFLRVTDGAVELASIGGTTMEPVECGAGSVPWTVVSRAALRGFLTLLVEGERPYGLSWCATTEWQHPGYSGVHHLKCHAPGPMKLPGVRVEWTEPTFRTVLTFGSQIPDHAAFEEYRSPLVKNPPKVEAVTVKVPGLRQAFPMIRELLLRQRYAAGLVATRWRMFIGGGTVVCVGAGIREAWAERQSAVTFPRCFPSDIGTVARPVGIETSPEGVRWTDRNGRPVGGFEAPLKVPDMIPTFVSDTVPAPPTSDFIPATAFLVVREGRISFIGKDPLDSMFWTIGSVEVPGLKTPKGAGVFPYAAIEEVLGVLGASSISDIGTDPERAMLTLRTPNGEAVVMSSEPREGLTSFLYAEGYLTPGKVVI